MGVGETVGRGWVVVVDVLGFEIEFSVLFLKSESESESEFFSFIDESLGFETFLEEDRFGRGGAGDSKACDSLAKTSKWKSTESAQERKTIAFMTDPLRANVCLSNAARVTRRCFAGTTMNDCRNCAGAKNSLSFPSFVSRLSFFSSPV